MNSLPLRPAERLIVALDVATVAEAQALVELLSPLVDTFKIGYWLLFDPQLNDLLLTLRQNNKMFFMDAKLNDIPETVQHGVAAAVQRGADFITVHSDGAILDAAMRGKGDSAIKIMAVTTLTSQSSLASRSQFRIGLVNAMMAECDGLIMSPTDLTDRFFEIYPVTDMLIATPGVRMSDSAMNDHGRVGTPAAAIRDGADYIIVGRPIIRAIEPLREATRIIADIAVI